MNQDRDKPPALQPTSSVKFTALLVLAYLLFASVTVLRHEMWRDELQAWLIARDSPNLGALLYHSRFEVHPALWYLLLFPVTRLTHNPAAMQWLHLAIAAGAVTLFVRYSPFSRVQKVLGVFGYFLVFEYAVVARNYGLGVLFLFAFLALWPLRRRTYLPAALVLALMVQTNAFAILVAFACGCALVVEWAIDRDLRGSLRRRVLELAACAALLFLGLGFAAYQISPPRERSALRVRPAQEPEDERPTALTAVWNSYVPVLPPTSRFWNKNVIGSGPVRTVLGLLLLAGALLIFSGRPVPFVFYAVGTGALLLFIGFRFGVMRHQGHLFLTFLGGHWLLALEPRVESGGAFQRRLAAAAPVFLTVLLVFHTTTGVRASLTDWARPFSRGKAVAELIRREGGERPLVVAERSVTMPSVVGYLEGPFYYPHYGRFGTFLVWSRDRKKVTDQDVLDDARRLSGEQRRDALIVLDHSPTVDFSAATHVGDFRGSVVTAEEFRVYRLPYPPGQTEGVTQ